jgi:hypothetical protein
LYKIDERHPSLKYDNISLKFGRRPYRTVKKKINTSKKGLKDIHEIIRANNQSIIPISKQKCESNFIYADNQKSNTQI